MPQKASIIGIPRKEVLPRGTVRSNTAVTSRDQLSSRLPHSTIAAPKAVIIQGIRSRTSRSEEKLSVGTCRKIRAGRAIQITYRLRDRGVLSGKTLSRCIPKPAARQINMRIKFSRN